MNFYEEIEKEAKEAELEGKVIEIPNELKATKKDFEDLERKIEIRTKENEEMFDLSIKYAKESMPC